MAILEVIEFVESDDGSITDSGDREYTQTYKVITDDAATRSGDILNSGLVPRWGDPYLGGDPGAVCRGVSCRRESGSAKIWSVEARFTSAPRDGRETGSGGGDGGEPTEEGGTLPGSDGGPAGDGQPQQGNPTKIENPLLRPAEISWSSIKEQMVCIYDIRGRLIANSAGAKFDPPITKIESHQQLRVTRNQATYNGPLMDTYIDTINDRKFAKFPTETVKISDISASRKNENGIWYWEATYVFEIKAAPIDPDDTDAFLNGFTHIGWWKRVLDAGWYYYRQPPVGPQENTPRVFRDRIGDRLNIPGLLDGDIGDKLADGAEPKWKYFLVNRRANFNLLRLV